MVVEEVEMMSGSGGWWSDKAIYRTGDWYLKPKRCQYSTIEYFTGIASYTNRQWQSDY